MLVINPLCLMSEAQLKSRMAEFFETVKQSPMWDEDSEMLLPGEIEYRSEKKRLEDGIPIPEPLFRELIQLAEELGLDKSLHLDGK